MMKMWLTMGQNEKSGSNSDGEEVRTDLAYLHSTVYTVIGCSIAFIVIVLGLGLAICRLHLLRKSQRSARVSLNIDLLTRE